MREGDASSRETDDTFQVTNTPDDIKAVLLTIRNGADNLRLTKDVRCVLRYPVP
jgi:hypothetical protein